MKYKGIFPYGSFCNHYYNPCLGHNVAHTLFDAGVQKVFPCRNFISGKKDTEHLDLWAINIQCEPNISVEIVDKFKRNSTVPLLWAILKELGIGYSGGASDGYMQAGFSKDKMYGWKVKNLDPELFILRICAYFNAIKEHHESRDC